MRKQIIVLLGMALLFYSTLVQAADETLLLRSPTASANHLAFVYAGDIWVSDLNGTNPRRLTIHPGVERDPHFSPDGSKIAFTGWYGGNYDLFVVSVQGGEPTRLTWHPGVDITRGWTPDGKQVLFTSNRKAFKPSKQFQLWTVAATGGFPEALPMPTAFRGAITPDGERIAYTPIVDPPFGGWKRYRGGMTPPIWIFDFKTQEIEKVPHNRTNDRDPIWVGKTLYFISDRDRIANIYAYNSVTQKVVQVTYHDDFDVLNATASQVGIHYEHAGRIHRLDPVTGKANALSIKISADYPDVRPHWEAVADTIESGALSPDGSQVVFSARGDIHLVAAKSGHSLNLTKSSSSHQRTPVWSRDGKSLAWFSDHSGEYQLVVHNLETDSKQVVSLDAAPSFYFQPQWSPDNSKLLLVDKHNQLIVVDVQSGKVQIADCDGLNMEPFSMNPQFSPDSRYIAYTKNLPTRMGTLYIYDHKTKLVHQAADGMSDINYPVWSNDGQYIYFAASTDYGPRTNWMSIGNIGYHARYSIYALSLNKDVSPPLPVTDIAGKKQLVKYEKNSKKVKIKIDFKDLQDRITPLPIPADNYGALTVVLDGSLLLLKFQPNDAPINWNPGAKPQSLIRFDFNNLKIKTLAENISGYQLSFDSKKLLVKQGAGLSVADTADPTSVKPLDTTGMRAYVDPRAEWRQMYFEAWRLLRDYFYAPDMHGLNWSVIRDRYEPFLEHINHRSDLDYLLREMQGELVVGHAYVYPGDQPGKDEIPVGLLGADLELDQGKYRINKIYTGESWNPDFEAPLDRPGIRIKPGDYILAIDDRAIDEEINIYSQLVFKAGRETKLLVSHDAAGKNARSIYVKPADYKQNLRLRLRDWVENNRRKVDEMTDGKVAYVHMPDTAQWGHTYFYRYYYSQVTKEAAIIDDRFNDGGFVSDEIVNRMAAPLLSYWVMRDGGMLATPANIFGPKVMLINETSGSGGDALPHFFRRQGVGTLIGKRTWGGLAGIGYYPQLLDGGRITAPHFAILSPDGDWEVENEGVPPDIDIEQTPKLVINGHDPQLEKAVEVVLEKLKTSKIKLLKEPPPYPGRALE